jgi:acyl transferase domain-containing protein
MFETKKNFSEITKNQNRYPKIAVIGMGCHYPGARDLKQLWENILSRRQQFRQIPDVRLPMSEYYDRDRSVADKTYGNRAAVIDGFEFDWAKRRIPQKTVRATDIVHWLALETANQALEDAGYTRQSVPLTKTGVILGNTLTGEQTRSTTVRLRWPYVRKALRVSAKARGMSSQGIEALVETMEKFYKSAFAPITEDSLAGGLSNTIAGRICNFFNFDGGGYTVDGACASSLIATANACSQLISGDLDLVLAGGVDVSLDTFELIGFAKTGALTPEDMRVYDRRASGFIPGEGCGFVVLKRLEDARAAGDYVYAVIRGWGISSDGKGGITAPSKTGQSKALLRAYEKAGYHPAQLDFIEGHGTGTPVGDLNELEGIALAVNSQGEVQPRSVGVTSFKSLVGHTKAAAGVGGLIKAVMAVNQRVIPPTAGCQELNPVFATTVKCAYPVLNGEVCSPDVKLRAGVSAMGFGGINSHVTLESGDSPAQHLKPRLSEGTLLVSNQDSELFVFSANSIEKLLQRIQQAIELSAGMSLAEMGDLALQLTTEIDVKQEVRAAVIARTPQQLQQILQKLERYLEDSPPAKGELKTSPSQDFWIANHFHLSRVGFVFPGQGSQRLNMARMLVERHDWAKKLVQKADEWLKEIGCPAVSPLMYRCLEKASDETEITNWLRELSAAEVASPAICLASLLWLRHLKELGIQPVALGGHSLGELTAFYQAGAFDEKTLIQFAAIRGRALANVDRETGGMVSLGCDLETARQIIKEVSGYAVIANINSPIQTVVSGEFNSIAQTIDRANAKGIQSRQLPVANAFHSQMVEKAANYVKNNAPLPDKLEGSLIPLFSSIDGREVTSSIDLRQHFGKQITSSVDFVTLTTNIYNHCDLIIEVGPGRVLSNLVNTTLNIKEPVAFSIEAKTQTTHSFNSVLGRLFVANQQLNWSKVYENRLLEPFVPAKDKLFIDNPCEHPLQVSDEYLERLPNVSFDGNTEQNYQINYNVEQNNLMPSNGLSERDFIEILSKYFDRRNTFLAELIQADLENLPLSNLHLEDI